MAVEKNDKYIVWKLSDLARVTTKGEQMKLDGIQMRIRSRLQADGKNPNPRYLVISMDEPYINEVIEILKKHKHWG